MSTNGELMNNNSNNASQDFKRKRNFTEEEKNFLVELVQQHQQIITSKDNKSSMKILKDKVWSEIHQHFNDNNMRNFNNSTRTLDQLKKCWENLRTKAKREYKQLSIGNSLEENNLQHKIISIIGDELDHNQTQQPFEFGDSFAIDYETDFNIIGTINQNLHDSQQLQVQSPSKPQMRQILVNKLISKQQQLQDDLNDDDNGSLVDEYRMQGKKQPIIGKQQLIVEGKLVNNPEDVVVENEHDLGDDLNGDDMLDEDEDLMDEIEEEMGYEDDLQYDEEDADLEDDVDEIVYEEDGMLTSVVRNKSSNNNNLSVAGQNSKQSNNNTSPYVNGSAKRLKSNNTSSTIEDGHSSSNHSNSLNNFKYSPQQNKKYLAYNNARNYSNGMLINKSMYQKGINNKLINNNNLSNSNLNEALSDLKLREQRTRLRMARLELIANRRRAQLELELAMAKIENERRKKQLLERQLENEQLTHRIYRKKIEKQN